MLSIMVAITFLSSCGDDNDVQLNGDSSISAFVFESFDPDISGSIDDNSISATVPYDADVTSLTPTITVASTATVAPASGVSQDFSSPVSYTVTAQNGSQTTYSVTITVEEPPTLVATAKWERTLANGELPSWFTANNDRDIAVGGDLVYIHSNNDKIRIVAAEDGADQTNTGSGAGAMMGFLDAKQNFASGNFFLISIDTDDNGALLGANLRSGGSGFPWNVYHWDSPTADQELYFNGYNPPEGIAVADNISVVGSIDGDGFIYAPGDGFFGSSNKVLKLEISNGSVNDTPTEITIASDDFTELGNGNDVYPVSSAADANLILAGTNVGISEYTSTGEFVGSLPEALKNDGETAPLFTFALDVRPFELSGRKVIATTATDFTSNAADGGWLYLIDYTDGWESITADNITRIAFTPDGNIDANLNGTGGVDVTVDGDEATVYAVITNFGIAAYTVSFENL